MPFSRRLLSFCVIVIAVLMFTAAASKSPGSINVNSNGNATFGDIISLETAQWRMSGNFSDPRHEHARPPGITAYPAAHKANLIEIPARNVSSENLLDHLIDTAGDTFDYMSDAEYLRRFDQARAPARGQILQSSFAEHETTIVPDHNGFVSAAVSAYSWHHHLIIRPDDIWLAILTQFSTYVNANAEQLRETFVSHTGQKTLKVNGLDTRFDINWASFAQQIGDMIQENIKTPEMQRWIIPEFTTTTSEDEVIASIVTMATMQKYFKYEMNLVCGLPSVTLLGAKSDYENILQRVKYLKQFGEEPVRFANELEPILKRLFKSFDEPSSKETIEFWNSIVKADDRFCGMTFYSGWITAFAFWDADGKILDEGRPFGEHDDEPARYKVPLVLDGIEYRRIQSEDIPSGFVTVSVDINDNGEKIKAEMLAGSIGIQQSQSGEVTDQGVEGIDTMQPKSGWWIYEKDPEVHKGHPPPKPVVYDEDEDGF